MGRGPAQLVLDIGGVLLPDLTPHFWRWVAAHTTASYDEILAHFRRDVREPLWTGAITEEQFWRWLHTTFPLIDDGAAQAYLTATLKPLPAAAHLAAWAQVADIHLLSNHRGEWAIPALSNHLRYVTSVTISSAVGYCKPQPAIYDVVASRLLPDATPVYVEDQEKNFPPAAALGWKTVCADASGEWASVLHDLLNEGYRTSR